MYYLVESTTTVGGGERDISVRLLMKSSSIEKLQEEIRRLFDNAIDSMDDDMWVNNCSSEDFDDNNGCYYKNQLSVYTMFPTPGMEWEDVNYAIVDDKKVKEI